MPAAVLEAPVEVPQPANDLGTDIRGQRKVLQEVEAPAGGREDRLEHAHRITRVGHRRAVHHEAVDDGPHAEGRRRAVEGLGQMLDDALDARLLP